MNSIKLKNLILKEELEISDLHALESLSTEFSKKIIELNILKSKHKPLTTMDVDASQYVEDLSEIVRNEVVSWVNTVNKRGGR
jgi:hypothetical protein